MLDDVNVQFVGCQKCDAGHSFGPYKRDYYLVHYVLSGKGRFENNGKTYELTKGQGFLIEPNSLTFYQADLKQPWHYTWVAFDGTSVKSLLSQCGLSGSQPIFTYTKDEKLAQCFKDMNECALYPRSELLRLSAQIRLFFSYLIDQSTAQVDIDMQSCYFRKALEYIHMNFMNDVGVSQVAAHIGINRSYFCRIFKEQANISPSQYILQYRMERASELLMFSNLLVAQIARLVGYPDQLAFSKCFKNIKGSSPQKFRSNTKESLNCYDNIEEEGNHNEVCD